MSMLATLRSMAAQATMSARSVKQVAQMAVTKPTSLSFLRRPRLSMGNLQHKGRARQQGTQRNRSRS